MPSARAAIETSFHGPELLQLGINFGFLLRILSKRLLLFFPFLALLHRDCCWGHALEFPDAHLELFALLLHLRDGLCSNAQALLNPIHDLLGVRRGPRIFFGLRLHSLSVCQLLLELGATRYSGVDCSDLFLQEVPKMSQLLITVDRGLEGGPAGRSKLRPRASVRRARRSRCWRQREGVWKLPRGCTGLRLFMRLHLGLQLRNAIFLCGQLLHEGLHLGLQLRNALLLCGQLLALALDLCPQVAHLLVASGRLWRLARGHHLHLRRRDIASADWACGDRLEAREILHLRDHGFANRRRSG
mmetsp:Transcript_51403/g.143718  ORF Transcript_51403/g.143718 Transcript_51403/m.143718 type:complete len:301 (-) Transcript_51403:439-1341(-)